MLREVCLLDKMPTRLRLIYQVYHTDVDIYYMDHPDLERLRSSRL